MAPLWCLVLLIGTCSTTGVSQATYQAHMLHVCCQQWHFRTPAAHSVNAAEHPSVYLCLHFLIPTSTQCNTYLQIIYTHAHLVTYKTTHPNTNPDTCRHCRPLKNKLIDNGGMQMKHPLTCLHTHTYICIHYHAHNSRQIVYPSIGSLTK